MALRVHPLFSNFTLGEISPRLFGNVTFEKYHQGCKTLENFLIQPQGGVSGRPGSRFVKEVKTSANATRLIPFRASDSLAYVLELGNLYLRIYHDGSQLESVGVPVEITPEGYRLTALTTVEIMKRILNSDFKTGFQTPSLAYGADFILQFNGVEREDLA